ncbi:class I SAM-dependent methyltransferase [Oculatella sp. LEGE 06141]|uniref:class I SAM-dependent methyltransferase n=1 Tax=Oculatella sp. LEGE 06141 TaxID=1828648 RepID=UPI00187E4C75|nr:class I SAM-dependent methyltransferase [Oculatella sp. LEGE 06141]MBE9178296.1 class I SAM-dependent methyltransferase [Oculatella sp. LEGE 06141]
MFIASVLTWLKLPEASRVQDLDDPNNVYIIRKIIQRKPFLHKTYRSFYKELLSKARTTPTDGEFIELGSGAGFLKTLAPRITTSDILPYEGVDKVFSALDIPFEDDSVSAFMMIDVMHHVKDSRQFLNEMQRCLKVGGKIVMIEPANTIFSKFIYTHFHHEPFETRAGWGFEEGGPLSGANMAIPWIVFCRDRQIFFSEFPNLRLCSVRLHTPFRYLCSGGLSIRQLLPSWMYPLVQVVEKLLSPFNSYLGMFMTIELENLK